MTPVSRYHGRLLSLVDKECSSRIASVPVLIKARHNRSLTWLAVNGDQRQSDKTDHGVHQLWLSCHRHRHVSWQSVQLDVGQLRCARWNYPFKPTLASGRALNQSPESDSHKGMRRACSTWSVAPFNRISARTLQQTSSQILWAFGDGIDGAGLDACLIHAESDGSSAVLDITETSW